MPKTTTVRRTSEDEVVIDVMNVSCIRRDSFVTMDQHNDTPPEMVARDATDLFGKKV